MGRIDICVEDATGVRVREGQGRFKEVRGHAPVLTPCLDVEATLVDKGAQCVMTCCEASAHHNFFCSAVTEVLHRRLLSIL